MKKRPTLEQLKAAGIIKSSFIKTTEQAAIPFPAEGKKKRSRVTKYTGPKMETNDLTKLTIRYFRAKGYWCWRNNNVAVFDPKIGAYRKGNVTKGIPDVIGYHMTSGIALYVEIKNRDTKDKTSPEQEAFLLGAKKAGCHVYVVRSVDDLK